MSYYQKHVLLCTNQKAAGKQCCANSGGEESFSYMKTKISNLGLHGAGKIRVSKTGCLGRCALGPCLVIYPEGTWYRYISEEDLDKIIASHLNKGEVVEELTLDPQGVLI